VKITAESQPASYLLGVHNP